MARRSGSCRGRIVADGGSIDNTGLFAKAAGARVLIVRGEPIAVQRNAGLESARNKWILALDADERVSPQLRAELGQVVVGRSPTHSAYRMKFRNHYLGQELRHGPWGRDWHVRLFSAGRFSAGYRCAVHGKGRMNSRHTDPFELRRIKVDPAMSLGDLRWTLARERYLRF